MHMADALISPAVGGVMWAVSAGLLAYCGRIVRKTLDAVKVPLMGMLGAFIFAAQMINFSIPGTGSSGHLGGGLILAVLLGPHAAFLVMASVLFVQAMLFADGGLLALGCNIFNLGFFPCFVAYPLIFKPLWRGEHKSVRFWTVSITAAVSGLVAGSLCVVLETWFSGVSELPFRSFALLMTAIHLAIGVVEGLVTAGVVALVLNMETNSSMGGSAVQADSSGMKVPAVLGVLAIITAGVLSWFASTHPDGLEWAVERAAGDDFKGRSGELHEASERLQSGTSVLPDYGFAATEDDQEEPESESSWPGVSGGTTVAGIVGGSVCLIVAGGLGIVLRKKRPLDAAS